MFVSKLEQKAEAGGSVNKFPTSTALSQECQCGYRIKKKLSLRWHICSNCGVTAQRDLYSAFLARHIRKDDNDQYYLDNESAAAEWPKIKPLLDKAVEKAKKKYGHKAPTSFGI